MKIHKTGTRDAQLASAGCWLRVLVATTAAALVAAGCKPSAPPPDPNAVVMVNDVPITKARLMEHWEKRQRGIATNLPAAAVLSDLVDEQAAYCQAQRSGFLDRPEVKAALRNYAAAKYREEKYGKLFEPPEPAEKEVREAYAQRRESFIRPAAVNLAILFMQVPRLATPEKRQEALQTITSWREEIASSPNPAAAFSGLAAKHSSDTATRYQRGELGWMTADELRRRLPTNIVAPALSLTNGALSQPLEAPEGYYLVRLLGHRLPEVRPFEEVQALLKYQLRQEHRARAERQFREEVRAGLAIRTNVSLLETLVLTNKPPAPPPAMPRR
jgi:hypothetical protein